MIQYVPKVKTEWLCRYRMAVSMYRLFTLVTVWPTKAVAHCCCPASLRRFMPLMASLENDQNSKFKVQILLKSYCFYTINKVEKSLSQTIISWRPSVLEIPYNTFLVKNVYRMPGVTFKLTDEWSRMIINQLEWRPAGN